ncbi:MAG TPA: hypothetical protein VGB78_10835 [Thermoplasmata archaeon]|jgi:hypothetical protein
MALSIRLLQLATSAVYVIIVALAFTSIWPFPSGDFRIDLPSSSEVEWTYSDGVVSVVAPYSIDNGGFYDVDDLSISYSVTNYTGFPLANDTVLIGEIPAGRMTSSSLVFEFDLQHMYDSGADWMIFNDDALNFFIEVSCYYTMTLIEFDATYRVNVPWDALIQSWGVSRVSPWPPTGTTLSVDYWLHTSDLLASLPEAQATVRLYGDSILLDEVQQTIGLGGNYSSTVSLDIPLAVYSTYTVVYSTGIDGFTISDQLVLEVP